MRIIRYESIDALRHAADAWDDLWLRSEVALPNARAEAIAQWIEQLAPAARLIALAVEHDGQLVAALPLIERRLKYVVTVGSLPWNHWSWAGDLLIDPAADVSPALAVLSAEIRRLPWPLLCLDAVPLEGNWWHSMLEALDAAGLDHLHDERFRIGTVEIDNHADRDWGAYQEAWSGNHRRHMRKAARRAAEEGGVELDIRHPRTADETESLVREGFAVEQRSWKGRAGTSVLESPQMLRFYLRQATLLAHWGQLELVFLRCQGQAIAFEYGWRAKGTYFTPKVGYDDAFSRFSPGQMLRYKYLAQAFADHAVQRVDFLGPLSEATAKWSTRTYPVSKLFISTGKLQSRLVMSTLRRLFLPLRRNRASCPHELVQIRPLPTTAEHA